MSNTDGGNAGTDNGTQGAGNATDAGTTQGASTATAATGADKTFTQADIDRIVADRLSRERGKFADYDDLKAKATKFDEFQESQKTDLEKANDRIAALEAENQTHKLSQLRATAAAEAGLPPELAEFITATDAEQAQAQAKRLAERMQPSAPPAADMRQGYRPYPPRQESMDDWFRRQTGRGA